MLSRKQLLVILALLSLALSIPPAKAQIAYEFSLRGAAVSANVFVPSAKSYIPNAWQLLRDAGVNWIRVSGGTEGDVNHFNIAAYPNEWYINLETLLSEADKHGIKVSFTSLGTAYGTLFGIHPPGSNAHGSADPNSYTPIDEAKAIIDKLAGNNPLNHNFITDPRILGWVTSNEVYIGPEKSSNPNLDGPLILSWNLELLDYIRSKGGKAWMASPTTMRGTSEGYNFAYTIPLIGSHVDFLEAHYYEEPTLLQRYVKADGKYDWAAFESYYRNLLLQKMVNVRGDFSLDKILLGEFGMWVGAGNDFGLTTNFKAQDRRAYYQAVLKAARDAGLENVCQFDFFEEANTKVNNFAVVNLETCDFFEGEAADVLRDAYGACSVALSFNPTVTLESPVAIEGKIFPAYNGITVSLYLQAYEGAWISWGSAQTDLSGYFSFVGGNLSSGLYNIKASWQTDMSRLVESPTLPLAVGAVSTPSAVAPSVTPSVSPVDMADEVWVVPVVVGTFAVVVLLLVAVEIRRRRGKAVGVAFFEVRLSVFQYKRVSTLFSA